VFESGDDSIYAARTWCVRIYGDDASEDEERGNDGGIIDLVLTGWELLIVAWYVIDKRGSIDLFRVVLCSVVQLRPCTLILCSGSNQLGTKFLCTLLFIFLSKYVTIYSSQRDEPLLVI